MDREGVRVWEIWKLQFGEAVWVLLDWLEEVMGTVKIRSQDLRGGLSGKVTTGRDNILRPSRGHPHLTQEPRPALRASWSYLAMKDPPPPRATWTQGA